MEVKDREDKDIRQPDLKSMNMEELGTGSPVPVSRHSGRSRYISGFM